MEMTYEHLKRTERRTGRIQLDVNDENEDTPELLAEQERLLNAIIAAEAADLAALSAKALIAHFNKRAPGEHLAKGLSKAALIAKINSLPPLAAPEPTPTPAAEPEPTPCRGRFQCRWIRRSAWPRRAGVAQEASSQRIARSVHP